MTEAHLFSIGLALAALSGVRVYLTVFGVDSGWDLLHTFLRIPVGAFLAAVTLSPDGHLGAAALATGASAALLTHVLKSSTRALINGSPEPVSNWTASLGEDAAVLGGLTLVFAHPWLALALILGLAFSLFGAVLWLAKKLFRKLRRDPSLT